MGDNSHSGLQPTVCIFYVSSASQKCKFICPWEILSHDKTSENAKITEMNWKNAIRWKKFPDSILEQYSGREDSGDHEAAGILYIKRIEGTDGMEKRTQNGKKQKQTISFEKNLHFYWPCKK